MKIRLLSFALIVFFALAVNRAGQAQTAPPAQANLYPPAWREVTRSAIRSGSVVSGIALTSPGPLDDVFDVQRAAAQPFDVEPQVVSLGRIARGVSQHGRYHRHRSAVADHRHGQRAAQ